MNIKEFSALGVAAKQKKAAERREKVRKLRFEEGKKAREIAEILGEPIRLIYTDIVFLKKESAREK